MRAERLSAAGVEAAIHEELSKRTGGSPRRLVGSMSLQTDLGFGSLELFHLVSGLGDRFGEDLFAADVSFTDVATVADLVEACRKALETSSAAADDEALTASLNRARSRRRQSP